MKTKITLIALIAVSAVVSLASTQIAKKEKEKSAAHSSTKSSGFVSEEI